MVEVYTVLDREKEGGEGHSGDTVGKQAMRERWEGGVGGIHCAG